MPIGGADPDRTAALRPLAAALMAGFLIVACAGVPGTTQQPGPASPGTAVEPTWSMPSAVGPSAAARRAPISSNRTGQRGS